MIENDNNNNNNENNNNDNNNNKNNKNGDDDDDDDDGDPSVSSSSSSSVCYCRILYSTQSGRAKACARRTFRILRERCGGVLMLERRPSTVDEDFARYQNNIQAWANSLSSTGSNSSILILLISTTGDGEHTDTISNFWRHLLQKSVFPFPNDFSQVCIFGLGDRAYGPQFCAAARKLAVRLVQLTTTTAATTTKKKVEVGYGDDGTPGGGVLADLDTWLETQCIPMVMAKAAYTNSNNNNNHHVSALRGWGNAEEEENDPNNGSSSCLPYQVKVMEEQFLYLPSSDDDEDDTKEDEKENVVEEWNHPDCRDAYAKFFNSRAPMTAYQYYYSQNNNNDTSLSSSILRSTTSTTTTTTTTTTNNDTTTPTTMTTSLLLARITENKRLSALDWEQDTRHLRLEVEPSLCIPSKEHKTTATTTIAGGEHLPYYAGDVVSILPRNTPTEVNRFLSVLPPAVRSMAHTVLEIHPSTTAAATSTTTTTTTTTCRTVLDSFVCFPDWPSRCTLYGWLMYCADFVALPEREDLWALSHCCGAAGAAAEDSVSATTTTTQRDKLLQLSQGEGSALYTDYILRQKRNWTDVLYDFDALRAPESKLSSLPILFSLLSPLRPREFSIASRPIAATTTNNQSCKTIEMDLCVAVVEGKTPLGRSYHGLCSDYICRCYNPTNSGPLCCWIRPGSFQQLPLSMRTNHRFVEPVLYIGAGTGIAPLRGLIQERMSRLNNAATPANDDDDHKNNNNNSVPKPFISESSEQQQQQEPTATTNVVDSAAKVWDKDDILLFGCRKKSADFYYQVEWESCHQNLGLLTAFSQDQWHKIYVQQVLRSADPTGERLMFHLLNRGGSIYIAGGAKMARSIKEEIVELLAKQVSGGGGGETAAKQMLVKLQRLGRFRVEAWS